VRAGELLLDSGRIPTTDTFTYTVAGEPWLNQQWLAQLFLATTHRVGGWDALAIARAVLVGLTFGLALRAALVRGAAPRTAALLTLAAFVVAAPALALRPQLLGLALFAFLLLIVAERRRRANVPWLAPVVLAIWANVHGSFVVGLALLGVTWLEDMADDRGRARGSLLVLGVSVIATLVNPFVVGVWTSALGLATNPEVTDQVAEWQATSVRSVTGLLCFGSVALVAAFLARRGRAAPGPTLLWVGVLALVGALAVRGVAWWALGAAVAVAGLLERPSVERVAPDPPTRLAAAVAGVVLVATVVLLPFWRPPDPLTGRVGLLTQAPPEATDAVRAIAGPGDRLFAPQPLGSWLELTVPVAPVFVDSRIELFGPDVWREHDVVAGAGEEWSEILDRWDVTIVVAEGPLAVAIAASSGWTLIEPATEPAIYVRADR
jgi:hypothetical protein